MIAKEKSIKKITLSLFAQHSRFMPTHIVMVCFSSVQVNFLVNYKIILCYCEKFGGKKKNAHGSIPFVRHQSVEDAN